jgi:hypothetical protein
MYNNKHCSFGKQALRALLGILVSVGFGAFWLGLCATSIPLILWGGIALLMGIFHLARAYIRAKRFVPKAEDYHRPHREFITSADRPYPHTPTYNQNRNRGYTPNRNQGYHPNRNGGYNQYRNGGDRQNHRYGAGRY